MSEYKYRVKVPTIQDWRDMVKCQAACPVLTDSRGYVLAAARGDLETAYRISHDPNPLSTVCGRICGAPCELAWYDYVNGGDTVSLSWLTVSLCLSLRCRDDFVNHTGDRLRFLW